MQNMLAKLIITLLIVLMWGCTNAAPEPESTYTRVTEGTLNAGDTIPQPANEVILTVNGKIGTTNQDDSIVMDLAMIESVGLVEYDVDDPFQGESVVYTGILMSDLLKLWQVPEDATTLEMVALNDYTVDVPMVDLWEYPVLFALKDDGEYMPISDRGPAMLVYPYNDYEFDDVVYGSYWIWQIKTINVK